ncbi:MAG: ATP-binding cassette domain-containing protein, partial [Clostridiaceae bacterium]
MSNLLEVNDLKTSFFTHVGEVKSVRGISLSLEKGEALGIVGESGCGKSVTMMSIMRLLQENGKIVDGEVKFNGKDIKNMSEKEMEKIRGNDIGMIFQDPMTSLNPVYTVGDQLTEPLIKHRKI